MSFIEVILGPLAFLIDTVLALYMYVVIVAVIASWLIAFGVLNTRNPLARQLIDILVGLTEPVFRRIRRIVPAIGGLDLSPVIVVIALQLLRIFFGNLFFYIATHL